MDVARLSVTDGAPLKQVPRYATGRWHLHVPRPYPVQVRTVPDLLINTAEIELLPAHLLRARSNADARTLASSDWLLRRKRDGRYLAAASATGLRPLLPHLASEPGIEAALAALDALAGRRRHRAAVQTLSLDRLQSRLQRLGLDADQYAASTGLSAEPEPAQLTLAGFDRYRRPLWLTAAAARGWRRLQIAAAGLGVALDAISGYRSHDYQLGIFERKFARGQSLPQILQVNAAPGFSEHHSGNALDLGSPGQAPAEETFEDTAAFAWLSRHAGDYGFRMSYPRNNPHGIVYEPWHWRFHTPSNRG